MRLADASPVRVVYSNQFGARNDSEVIEEIVKLMPHVQYKGQIYMIDEVIYINKDGSIIRLIIKKL